MSTSLEKTAEFWNSDPCDKQENFLARAAFRYGKEPWLKIELENFANSCKAQRVLEVGCGQGTDALTLCQWLAPENKYLGIDYSGETILAAKNSFEEVKDSLRVVPEFCQGNAEHLNLGDGSVDQVYSMGVLHHTPDTERAIAEIYRVLRSQGTARLALYRTFSPKLLIALSLRAFQKIIDRVTRQEKSIYKWARYLPFSKVFGTAIQECFGVPILRSYTEKQIRQMFSRFQLIRLEARGLGAPPNRFNKYIEPFFEKYLGYYWYIECKK